MSCWKSAGGWAEAELLRALCSESQPQAPVSLLQLKPGSGSGPSHLSQLLPLSQDGAPFPGTPSPHRLPACRAQAQLSAGICWRFLSSVLQLEMSNGKVTPASSWSTGSKAGALPGVAIASPLLLKSVWSCPMTSRGLPQLKPSDYYLQGELPNLQSIKIIQWIKMPFPLWNNSTEACSFPAHALLYLVCVQETNTYFSWRWICFCCPLEREPLLSSSKIKPPETNFSVKMRGLWIRT